jgi:hypothetical protein
MVIAYLDYSSSMQRLIPFYAPTSSHHSVDTALMRGCREKLEEMSGHDVAVFR